MKWIAVLLASLMAFSTVAKENPEFVVTGFSYHMDKRQYWENTPNPRDYNEFNIGAGIEYRDIRYVVFNNSYYRWSVAAMWVPTWELTENLEAGFRLGAALGYGNSPAKMPVMPVVGLELDYQSGNLHHILGTEGYQTLTYHIQLEF